MSRLLVTMLSLTLLPACAVDSGWQMVWPFAPAYARSSAAEYSFAWQLSGDHRVAPLQVFDDGRRTWLQLSSDQVAPAVFRSTAGGEQWLHYTRQGDYLILNGVWPKIIFRGGALKAYAVRNAGSDASTLAEASEVDDGNVAAAAGDKVSEQRVSDLSSLDHKVREQQRGLSGPIDYSQAQPSAVKLDDDVSVWTRNSFASLSQNPDPVRSPAEFVLTLQDQTIRQALHRWAQQAQWTFTSEHWAVNIDVPVSAEAYFGTSFHTAVQDVLEATELTERPLQPCFYSNRVLRVVPYAQSCDRSAGMQSS